jgi:hypothetical protein
MQRQSKAVEPIVANAEALWNMIHHLSRPCRRRIERGFARRTECETRRCDSRTNDSQRNSTQSRKSFAAQIRTTHLWCRRKLPTRWRKTASQKVKTSSSICAIWPRNSPRIQSRTEHITDRKCIVAIRSRMPEAVLGAVESVPLAIDAKTLQKNN